MNANGLKNKLNTNKAFLKALTFKLQVPSLGLTYSEETYKTIEALLARINELESQGLSYQFHSIENDIIKKSVVEHRQNFSLEHYSKRGLWNELTINAYKF